MSQPAAFKLEITPVPFPVKSITHGMIIVIGGSLFTVENVWEGAGSHIYMRINKFAHAGTDRFEHRILNAEYSYNAVINVIFF